MYTLKFWKNKQKKDRCYFLSFDNQNPVFCVEKKEWVKNKVCKRCLQSKRDICSNLLEKAKKLATSRSDLITNNFLVINITNEFAQNWIPKDKFKDSYYLQIYFQHSSKFDVIISSYNKDFIDAYFLDFHKVMEIITEDDVRKINKI